MTNAVIADTPATNKFPMIVSDQSKPVLDFELIGSVADRVFRNSWPKCKRASVDDAGTNKS